ncbi:metal-dependent hydrolase [Chloroflexia bacterium SDU3-3]|nr:metal-dependent hydrolase [Chloroflexia bacterium SDU3-3]
MSGYQTHMFIGGVAGLALVRALAASGQPPALGFTPVFVQHFGRNGPLLADLAVIAASALLATVPDIDEPGSFIARRAQAVIALAVIALAVIGAVGAGLPPAWWLVATFVGGLVGGLAGYAFVWGIRRAAGGHRRFTHSLVLAAACGLVAVALWGLGLRGWPLIPAALAWAIGVHDIGDLVTPNGLPLLHPFSQRSFRLLPEPLCRIGEPLVALLALLVVLALVGVLRVPVGWR